MSTSTMSAPEPEAGLPYPVYAVGSPEYTARAQRINAAKRQIRTDLSLEEWNARGYVECCKALPPIKDTVPRLDYATATPEQFGALREKPIVVTGATRGWPALERWTLSNLATRFGNKGFRVGDDDDGHSVKLKLNDYLWYAMDSAQHTSEDNPLYMFDRGFEDSRTRSDLLEDYVVPTMFGADLFSVIEEDERPPYRWFLVGAKGSGSAIHHDPLHTSAWNTCVVGHKRWAMFPPHTKKRRIIPDSFPELKPGYVGGAAAWFSRVFPLTQADTWRAEKPVEILQGPGDTVYIPAGWWHVVLNLDCTIAVTQNYADPLNYSAVAKKIRKKRKDINDDWIADVDKRWPTLKHECNQREVEEEVMNARVSSMR